MRKHTGKSIEIREILNCDDYSQKVLAQYSGLLKYLGYWKGKNANYTSEQTVCLISTFLLFKRSSRDDDWNNFVWNYEWNGKLLKSSVS